MRRLLSHCPNERSAVTFPFVTWDNGLSGPDIDAILAECMRVPEEAATTLGGDSGGIRRSSIRWIKWTEQNRWLFERMDNLILLINDWFYGFSLTGYVSMQYTEYSEADHGHYGWHMDLCMGNDHLPPDMIEPRKLSLSLLLNEPGEDFRGGDFQFNLGTEDAAQTAEQRKGRIIAFPSWMIHRVTPVTQGRRRSLVVWVSGPKFA